MMITLYRREPDDSLRYYVLHDRQLTLEPEWSFTTSWTTGGASWRERTHRCEGPGQMDASVRRLVKRKFREGYVLLYAFSGQDRLEGLRGSEVIAAELSRKIR
jgi:hypothetical protein